jgi:hypothetical protein
MSHITDINIDHEIVCNYVIKYMYILNRILIYVPLDKYHVYTTTKVSLIGSSEGSDVSGESYDVTAARRYRLIITRSIDYEYKYGYALARR